MNTQKFDVLVDGIKKEASIVKMLNLDDRTYVVYTVDNEDDTSGVFVSEVIKDEESYDKLVDINDIEVKKNIMELTKIIFS